MTTPPTGPSPGRLDALIARVTRSRPGAPASFAELKGSETAKAAGLAGAMIANNVIALVATIVFARLLKNGQGGGYGSLAALVSYFLILSVVGQALQVATAREGVLGRLGSGAGLIATVRRWTVSLLTFTVGLAVISVLLRQQIADLVGVKHVPWAAALGLPAAGLWLELSVLRGVLQGIGDYKGVGVSLVGEQAARLITGVALAAAGAGVAGAYWGTPLSFVAMCLYCAWRLKTHVEAETGESLPAGGHAAAGGAEPMDARAPGVGADLWADHHRRAPEHRHYRRQAPLHDVGRELLQRGRGRGQGADLGRDGSRLLSRPGGFAPPRRGEGPAADPCPRPGDRRRLRGSGAADLRVRVAPADQGGVRRRQDAGVGVAVGARAGVRDRSPAPTWRSSTCWPCIASGSWCRWRWSRSPSRSCC